MRRTLMAMMPKPSPEHKSLLLALDDRMCNRMKQEELEAICYRWAYQYALEAMKFIPLPYKPPTVMEFDNIETIKRAVEIDAGVALLPEPTVGRELAAGTLCAIRIVGDELVRPLGIVHVRGKMLAPTARRFIELLRGLTPLEESATAAHLRASLDESFKNA